MLTKTSSAIVAALLVSSGVLCRAQDRHTLRGLRAVDVLIEHVAPGAESDGLTTEQLRSDVESQLRQGGLEVTLDALETIYVNVNAHRIRPADTRYIYNIEFRLSQPATILRTSAVVLSATWSRAILGTTLLPTLSDRVRADLRALIDTFLADHLLVNPKP